MLLEAFDSDEIKWEGEDWDEENINEFRQIFKTIKKDRLGSMEWFTGKRGGADL